MANSNIVGTLDSWEANAAFWDAGMGANGNEYWNLLQKPYLQKLIPIDEENPGVTRVLDLATGNGMASRFLARRGASVVATDGSKEMLKYCRQRSADEGATRMQFQELDVTKTEDFESLLGSPLAVSPST